MSLHVICAAVETQEVSLYRGWTLPRSGPTLVNNGKTALSAPPLAAPPSQRVLLSLGDRWSEDDGEFPAFRTRMMN